MNYWLPRLTVLYVLCTGACCEETSSTFAGYCFNAIQSPDISLKISAAAVIPSGNTTYTDVIFPSVQLPSQTCGDRYTRCHVTIHYEEAGTRVAVLVAVGDGAAVALFDQESSSLNFIEQYFVPLPGTPSCALTTFIVDGAVVYGLCYEIVSGEEVIVQVFIIFLDFGTLSQSTIISNIGRNTRNTLYISEAFHSTCSGATFGTNLYWYGNAFLHSLRIDIDSPLVSMDTNISQCFDNGTQQVVLFQDRYLLAYCGSNTVEVDICGEAAPIVNSITFYCSGRRDTFLEVGAGNLSFNNNVIPFPLDLSFPYVGDCVEINGNVHFIGSSADGTIALTDVLQNSTTILSTDAIVNHQVIDNRFILYSNSTSSALLDLSCPDPSTPIHVSNVSFELSNFSANHSFSCFTVQPTQPPTMTTVPVETTAQALSGGAIVRIVVPLVLVLLISSIIIIVGLIILWKWRTYRSSTGNRNVPDFVPVDCSNGFTENQSAVSLTKNLSVGSLNKVESSSSSDQISKDKQTQDTTQGTTQGTTQASIEKDTPMLKLAEEEVATTRENIVTPTAVKSNCNKDALVTPKIPSVPTLITQHQSESPLVQSDEERLTFNGEETTAVPLSDRSQQECNHCHDTVSPGLPLGINAHHTNQYDDVAQRRGRLSERYDRNTRPEHSNPPSTPSNSDNDVDSPEPNNDHEN